MNRFFDWFIGALVVFIVTLVVLSSVVVIISYQSQKIDRDQIKVFLQYAYEWNYQASTNEFHNMSRIVDKPLQITFSENKRRLLLGIFNNNLLPICNVQFTVFFTDDIEVEADKTWRAMFPSKHYFTHFKHCINPRGRVSPDGNLWLKFKHIGAYNVYYIISAAEFEPIEGSLQIRVFS